MRPLVAVAAAAGVTFVVFAVVFALSSAPEEVGRDSRLGDAVQLLGGPVVLPLVTLVAIAALWLTHRRREATFLLIAAVGGALALYVSRGILQVLGADDDGGRLSDYPSGHEGGVVLLTGALTVLAWPRIQGAAARAGVVLALLGVVVVVGWARIDSGAHTWVDIVGGFVFAVGWLALSVLLVRLPAAREGSGSAAPASRRGEPR